MSAAAQCELDFDALPARELPDCRDFDGGTFVPERDAERLSGQMRRVFDLMRDGRWRKVEDIMRAIGGSHPSIQARLRDLRKPKFGAFTVERRDPPEGGTSWYRLVL